jgi:hypothetical protein
MFVGDTFQEKNVCVWIRRLAVGKIGRNQLEVLSWVLKVPRMSAGWLL